jgi:hypothetical protein
VDLTEHYRGLAEDVVGQFKPLDREVDIAVTYGLFPVGTGQGMSTGVMVVLSMKSVLINQFMTKNSVIYGPRPEDDKFREMVKSMIVDMRHMYDDLVEKTMLMAPSRHRITGE